VPFQGNRNEARKNERLSSFFVQHKALLCAGGEGV